MFASFSFLGDLTSHDVALLVFAIATVALGFAVCVVWQLKAKAWRHYSKMEESADLFKRSWIFESSQRHQWRYLNPLRLFVDDYVTAVQWYSMCADQGRVLGQLTRNERNKEGTDGSELRRVEEALVAAVASVIAQLGDALPASWAARHLDTLIVEGCGDLSKSKHAAIRASYFRLIKAIDSPPAIGD